MIKNFKKPLMLAVLFSLMLSACGANDVSHSKSTEMNPASSEIAADNTAAASELAAGTEGSADTETSADTAVSASTEKTAGADASASRTDAEEENIHIISLKGNTAELDGELVSVYDYTWHCDPHVSHDEVKNAPAEYHTGSLPETLPDVYIDRDLPYFPFLSEDAFRLVNYDGEQEWAYYYDDGVNDAYIFATLPKLGSTIPGAMMHTEEEAAANAVLHITRAGSYVLEGSWNGQIRIDLGEEAFTDEAAKVSVTLNGADICCTVAPGLVFASVYECDNAWEEQETHSAEVNTAEAGAVLILADGSENSISGTNVFRMLKTKYKDESVAEAVKTQKKQRKTDGALYSYMSMNICGEADGSGKLTVTSGFEGIDSELHLSFLGGNITVNSQDDGINVNEDHVSVVSFLGGTLTLHAAQGAEGDGVDSNGFIVLNGGTVSVDGIVPPDSALDSEDGITYLAGTLILDGQEQSYEPGSTFRETGRGSGMPGQRPQGQEAGPGFPGDPEQRPEGFPGEPGQRPEGVQGFFEQEPGADFDMKEFKQKVAELPDDAGWEDVLNILGWKMR